MNLYGSSHPLGRYPVRFFSSLLLRTTTIRMAISTLSSRHLLKAQTRIALYLWPSSVIKASIDVLDGFVWYISYGWMANEFGSIVRLSQVEGRCEDSHEGADK